MDDATRENINLKREINRFIARFFYNKEKSISNLAEIYFLLDDLIAYLNVEQTKIGNDLLDNGLKKEYIISKGKKVFLDEELQTILIDEITPKELTKLTIESNKKYVKGL